MYKTTSCTKMFSCVRCCISQDKNKCSCGIECSNLDILYYNKERNAQGVGLLYSQFHYLLLKVIQSL